MSGKSPTDVLLEVTFLCVTLSKQHVEPYSHRNSPQKFTQSQLLTQLVLRASLKTTCRGVVELVEVSDALRQRIGLTRMPHDSRLKKLADRSCVMEIIDALLLELVRLRRVAAAAEGRCRGGGVRPGPCIRPRTARVSAVEMSQRPGAVLLSRTALVRGLTEAAGSGPSWGVVEAA